MFPLFGKSSKSPTEVVRQLKEHLTTLEKGSDGKKQEKAQEEVSKQLVNMTGLLFGSDNEQQSDVVLPQKDVGKSSERGPLANDTLVNLAHCFELCK